MNPPRDRERRRHYRHRVRRVYRLTATEFFRLAPDRNENRLIRGRIHNMSIGGVGVLLRQGVAVGQLLRVEIGLAGSSVAMPTLMRVRWCGKGLRSFPYGAGLEFLLL